MFLPFITFCLSLANADIPINTATESQLASIDGVDLNTAQKIIELRKTKCTATDDLWKLFATDLQMTALLMKYLGLDCENAELLVCLGSAEEAYEQRLGVHIVDVGNLGDFDIVNLSRFHAGLADAMVICRNAERLAVAARALYTVLVWGPVGGDRRRDTGGKRMGG